MGLRDPETGHSAAITSLDHPEARVFVEALADGRRRIVVEPRNDAYFIPYKSCDTAYPLALIETLLELKGPAYLCDEILRDESPGYVQKHLEHDLLSYVEPDRFIGKRLLDFGCGSGGSTMVLSRMFPRTRIVGVELEEPLLAIARSRAAHYGAGNVELHLSPAPDRLPAELGGFDFVVLSAVFEHLLPAERATLLPALWSVLDRGGVLFLNQTPYRYFPVEFHSTSGLPLINYLPAFAAGPYARGLSRRKLGGQTWNDLLRGGIRGGTVPEILGLLGVGGRALLDPLPRAGSDRIDLWYAKSGKTRYLALKKSYRAFAKALKRLTGVVLVPTLTLALRKDGD